MTTTAGAELQLATFQALDRACESNGTIVVKVTASPDHGEVTVRPGMAFSNFTPGDGDLYLCNGRKSPATVASYRATPGFTGSDIAVIQVFFPDGHAPMIRYNITVR